MVYNIVYNMFYWCFQSIYSDTVVVYNVFTVLNLILTFHISLDITGYICLSNFQMLYRFVLNI